MISYGGNKYCQKNAMAHGPLVVFFCRIKGSLIYADQMPLPLIYFYAVVTSTPSKAKGPMFGGGLGSEPWSDRECTKYDHVMVQGSHRV